MRGVMQVVVFWRLLVCVRPVGMKEEDTYLYGYYLNFFVGTWLDFLIGPTS